MRLLTDRLMVKIVLTGLLTGFILYRSVAQTSITQEGSVLDILDPNSQNTELTFGTRYPDYQGNPYLFEDWKRGEVITHNGQKLEEVQLNLDLFSHQWLVQYEEKAYTLAEDVIAKVIVNPQTSKDKYFIPISLPPDNKMRFVQLLYQDTLTLIKTVEVQLNTIENNAGGYGGNTNSREIKRFIQHVVYHVMDSENHILRTFKERKKDILDAFDDRADIKKYIKRNKLKFKEETDIIQLVKYYQHHLKP